MAMFPEADAFPNCQERRPSHRIRRVARRVAASFAPTALCAGVVAALLAACASEQQSYGAAATIAAAYGARAPTHELEQTYYFGTFDPHDQLPPSFYRVRVRGQAAFLSNMRFASGWVPAASIDSLGTTFAFDKDGNASGTAQATPAAGTFETGRRLVLFGPEGFREAPASHRLVLVMGSSPEAFFSAIDQSLGLVAAATQGSTGPVLDRNLFATLVKLRSEKARVESLVQDARDAGTDLGVKP